MGRPGLDRRGRRRWGVEGQSTESSNGGCRMACDPSRAGPAKSVACSFPRHYWQRLLLEALERVAPRAAATGPTFVFLGLITVTASALDPVQPRPYHRGPVRGSPRRAGELVTTGRTSWRELIWPRTKTMDHGHVSDLLPRPTRNGACHAEIFWPSLHHSSRSREVNMIANIKPLGIVKDQDGGRKC